MTCPSLVAMVLILSCGTLSRMEEFQSYDWSVKNVAPKWLSKSDDYISSVNGRHYIGTVSLRNLKLSDNRKGRKSWNRDNIGRIQKIYNNIEESEANLNRNMSLFNDVNSYSKRIPSWYVDLNFRVNKVKRSARSSRRKSRKKMKYTRQRLRPLFDASYSKYYDQPNVFNSDTEYFFEISEKGRGKNVNEPTTRIRSKINKKNEKNKIRKLFEKTTTATDVEETYYDVETPDFENTTDRNMGKYNEKWTTNVKHLINSSTLRSKSYKNGIIKYATIFTEYSPVTNEACYKFENDEDYTSEITKRSKKVHPTFRIESLIENGRKHMIGGKSLNHHLRVKTTTTTESYSYEDEDDYPDDDTYNYDADGEYNAMKEENPDVLLAESVKSNKGRPTTCNAIVITLNRGNMMDQMSSKMYNKRSNSTRLEYEGVMNYTDDPGEESSTVQKNGDSVESCANCKTYFAVCKNLLEALERCGASSAINKIIPMAQQVTTSGVTTSNITSEVLNFTRCTSIASRLPLVTSTFEQTTQYSNKTTVVEVRDKLTTLGPSRSTNSCSSTDSTSRAKLLEPTAQYTCSCSPSTTTVEGGKQNKDKSLQEPKEQSGKPDCCNITSFLQSVCSLLNDRSGCDDKVQKISTKGPMLYTSGEQFTRRFIRLHTFNTKNKCNDSYVPNGFQGNITIINNTCTCRKNGGIGRIKVTKSINETTPTTCASSSISPPVTKVFRNRTHQGHVHPMDIIRYLHIHNPNSTEEHKKRKKKIYIIRANNLDRGRNYNFLNYDPIV